MARIEQSIEIDAPSREVWAVVSRLDDAQTWNPNIAATVCSSGPFGVGSTRRCVLSPAGSIDEMVSAWEHGRRIEFSIGSHGGIRSADSGFELHPGGGRTRVVAYADYHLAFGPLGPVIDTLTVRRQMKRMLGEALDGLRRHVEAGAKPGPRVAPLPRSKGDDR